jgi:hypothetical protein
MTGMPKRLAALFLLLMASAWPRISASTGTISYSIRTPSWLTTSSTTGATDTWGRHNHADGERECLEFAAGYLTYGPGVAFTNVSNGRGCATRAARLIVRCHRFLVRQGQIERGRGGYLLDSHGGYLLDAVAACWGNEKASVGAI